MEELIRKQLFVIFKNKKDDFELYEDLIKYVLMVIKNCQAKRDVYFYSVLSKLTNSINNAGHEERRSADISFISKEQQLIINDLISKGLEDLLP